MSESSDTRIERHASMGSVLGAKRSMKLSGSRSAPLSGRGFRIVGSQPRTGRPVAAVMSSSVSIGWLKYSMSPARPIPRTSPPTMPRSITFMAGTLLGRWGSAARSMSRRPRSSPFSWMRRVPSFSESVV